MAIEEPPESASDLENEAIAAMAMLVQDHGYTEQALLDLVKAALAGE